MNENLILIAAGGTGGHIYPGLAIAQAFEKEKPGLKVEFIGSPSGLESQLVPRAGYRLHHLSIGRLNRNVRSGERLKTLLLLPWAFLKAIWLVWRLKPRLVLGVGGAVSGPSVLAASWLGRAYIWEPNAVPGLANRWLAPFVKECLVVFPEAARHLKSRRILEVGMPIRQIIETQSTSSPVTLDRDSKPLRVLIFGGSQGARGLNDVVSQMLTSGAPALSGFEFVHQTGSADFARVQNIYQTAGIKVDVVDFIYDMENRYRWADLVIARSGMGTLAELAAAGKPAILVPLATASDNHQQKNAEVLVKKGAALLILQRDLTATGLLEELQDLSNHRTRLAELSKSIRQFHKPRADLAIARHLLEASV